MSTSVLRPRRRAALLATALLASGLVLAGPASAPAGAAEGLTSRAYFNDPYAEGDASNRTRNLVIDRFRGAPAGSVVRMVTFNITDTAISSAMVAAKKRGVQVRVVLARKNCRATAAKQLRRALGTQKRKPSYVVCATGSTRTPGGSVHQKSITFSSTGGSRYVTLVGSANQTVEGYADQWVDLYQYAGRKDVYTVFNDVFRLQKADRDLAQPYVDRVYNGGNGRSQFFPLAPDQRTAAYDPVLARINEIPRGPGTDIQVASYAVHGPRGRWLTDALVAHKAAGSKVRVLVGQPAGEDVIARLKGARIPVQRAYDPGCPNDPDASTCNYIHLKLMTATWVGAAGRQHAVWTGSDNWADKALGNDEVNQQIGGQEAWSQYVRFLAKVRAHYKRA
ncbi:phospholipase D-like domain-containing protein [Nocardioides sp. SYSU D00038]|uniref:phospholipase D-like domain-containing protein n=1 Tax=Nocardioides sp. SYSU D00038 TaxID=2812554 RepID=UPI001967EF66|nr:phospholipase D-like domain-containing protein [Nocardioides sp. SYSU D00038]